ncbi:arsenate reductase ArsC [Planctomycetota bacterium]
MSNSADKKKILFLCTGNSCRSQMAEGFARYFWGDSYDVFSAGIEKHGLNPSAVEVMGEAGVDISGHTCKTVAELGKIEFDYVVTVCDSARENCPFVPAQVKLIHQSFSDPPKETALRTTDKEKLEVYRRVRDEIRDFINTLPAALGKDQ